METIEDFVAELNVMANTYQIKPRKVMFPLLESMKERFNNNFRFVDFQLYSHESLDILKQEKLRYVKKQNFEMAAYFRTMEMNCLNIIEFMDEYKITKSTFIYEQNTLFYFCLSWTYVDELVKKFFSELDKADSVQPFNGKLNPIDRFL